MTEHKRPPVADSVRGIAAQRRVRQADLATELGLSRMAIVRRLNGTVPFTDRELTTLATYLSVPVGAFFGEVPVPPALAEGGDAA